MNYIEIKERLIEATMSCSKEETLQYLNTLVKELPARPAQGESRKQNALIVKAAEDLINEIESN